MNEKKFGSKRFWTKTFLRECTFYRKNGMNLKEFWHEILEQKKFKEKNFDMKFSNKNKFEGSSRFGVSNVKKVIKRKRKLEIFAT